MSGTPTRAKRLIEVDLPIRALSAVKSRRPVEGDVDVRHAGLWWSRKPQNQCRAILLAALLPDPAEQDEESMPVLNAVLDSLKQAGLALEAECSGAPNIRREVLTRFCKLVAEPGNLEARVATATARVVAILNTKTKVCFDPFAGGGSIPVEARRLGLHSIAGEYNPLALDQLRAAMEWGDRANTDRLPVVEKKLREAVVAAQEKASEAYPTSAKSGPILGFVVFRALMCEGPNCGRIVPATSKFVLDAKNNVRVIIAGDNGPGKALGLRVVRGGLDKSPTASMGQGKLRCPRCNFVMPRAAVVRQLRGGARKPDFVVAAVYLRNGRREVTALPDETQERLNKWDAGKELATLQGCIPTEVWPATEPRRFSPPLYGLTRFADCHTERQLLWLSALVLELRTRVPEGSDPQTTALYNGLARLLVARIVERHTSFCRWRSDRGGSFEWTFAGKSLGMIWDFFESNPLHPDNDARTIVDELIGYVKLCSERLPGLGTVLEGPAQEVALPDAAADLIYTDPPYFDAIPYSHLSDWMFVWARRVNKRSAGNELAPKEREIVVDRPHSKSTSTHDAAYFQRELSVALREVRRILKLDGIGVIVFAHSSTSAWESLVSALLDADFVVTASWPIETERGGRLQAQGTASLESSIHIVCRARENSKGSLRINDVGDWRDVLSELPTRIHEWMPRLAAEGIVGADAIFACLGPALEIFSRYSRVEKASGELVSLKQYLEQVWAAVSKEALAMIFTGADATGFEEDARITAMWLWTLSTATFNGANTADDEEPGDDKEDESANAKSTVGGFVLEYDAARKIAQGLGAHLEQLASLIEVNGATARLLPVAERTQSLFQKGEAGVPIGSGKAKKKGGQLSLELVADLEEAEASGGDNVAPHKGETVLDRVHQSMILFGAGRGEALKRFLVEDGAGRDDRFWRLAQAFSALYPSSTDEKRWVDGVLARKKSLGF